MNLVYPLRGRYNTKAHQLMLSPFSSYLSHHHLLPLSPFMFSLPIDLPHIHTMYCKQCHSHIQIPDNILLAIGGSESNILQCPSASPQSTYYFHLRLLGCCFRVSQCCLPSVFAYWFIFNMPPHHHVLSRTMQQEDMITDKPWRYVRKGTLWMAVGRFSYIEVHNTWVEYFELMTCTYVWSLFEDMIDHIPSHESRELIRNSDIVGIHICIYFVLTEECTIYHVYVETSAIQPSIRAANLSNLTRSCTCRQHVM